jgi:UDP-glucuronate 4-epimerase
MKRAACRLSPFDAHHSKTAIGILCFILHETASAERKGCDAPQGPHECRASGHNVTASLRRDVDVGDSVLVTGAAGFIGMHVAHRLLAQGHDVLGIDNLNPYYDPGLKAARVAELNTFSNFRFEKMDIGDRKSMGELFAAERFLHVVHLAAQAGVRHSLTDPHAYAEANLIGFLNVLEGCRQARARHLLYASSSSVYGANMRMPFRTSDNVDHPLNFYGATKKANELMAHAYAHLFAVPATGLRFFTVYGPWGRPDMAMWLFIDAIMHGRPIKLFNNGQMRRDFTYIDDVVEAVVRLVPRPPAVNPAWSADAPDPATSRAPWRIYNIGNSRPVEILEVVRLIEQATGKRAIQEFLPMQPGDVPETYADVTDLERAVDFRPCTSISDGIGRFVDWFRRFARI